MLCAAGFFGDLFGGPIGAAIGASLITPFTLISREYYLQGVDDIVELCHRLSQEFVNRIVVNGIAAGSGAYLNNQLKQRVQGSVLDPSTQSNFLIKWLMGKIISGPTSMYASM